MKIRTARKRKKLETTDIQERQHDISPFGNKNDQIKLLGKMNHTCFSITVGFSTTQVRIYQLLSNMYLLLVDTVIMNFVQTPLTQKLTNYCCVNWSAVKLIGVPSEQRSTRDNYFPQLGALFNDKNLFVCFLSDAGGTEKSEVINTMGHLCKLLYNELGTEFNKRKTVITAITGSAAVSILGETLYCSCNFNSKMETDNDWEHTRMVVVDEILSIKRPNFERLDKVLNAKYDALSPSIFGNLQMVFAGDFCQLKPPDYF